MSIELHGRPIQRSIRSAGDIIAGVDFLSVFMNSAEERTYDEPAIITHSPDTIEQLTTNFYHDRTTNENYQYLSIKTSENKTTDQSEHSKQSVQFISKSLEALHKSDTPETRTELSAQLSESSEDEEKTSASITERLLGLVPETLVDDHHDSSKDSQESTTPGQLTTLRFERDTQAYETKHSQINIPQIRESTNANDSPIAVSVENPRDIQSNSNNNEFGVEESGPITIDNAKPSTSGETINRSPESLIISGANPDYIAQQHARIHRDGLSNYNQPYIPRNSPRGRSVSYSTAVQALPQQVKWKPDNANRQENNPLLNVKDHYDNRPHDYDYTETSTNNPSQHGDSVAESKDYYVTRKYNPNPSDFNESQDKNPRNEQDGRKSYEHTERNWGLPEKVYGVPEKPYVAENGRNPTVYGQPEQNYEVDESVSVMSNGRVHGLQNPSQDNLQIKVGQPPVKQDDNHKVGYVVEGRNYRKYRVEEKTSDGFIVGEYGVVSNNDGSLRGVRYTADSTINPRLIYDALMKFLSL